MRLAAALLALSLVGIYHSVAMADQYGEQLGWLYLTRASDSYVPNLGGSDDPNGPLQQFVTFKFYVVAEIDYSDINQPEQNEDNGIQAWEASVVGIPPEMLVSSRWVHPSGDALNYGSGDNFAVGLAVVVPTIQPLVLVEYSAIFLTDPIPEDIVLTFGPCYCWASESSFDPPTPGWRELYTGECTGTCLRPFAALNGMTINCRDHCIESLEPIATEPTSWGSVKARY